MRGLGGGCKPECAEASCKAQRAARCRPTMQTQASASPSRARSFEGYDASPGWENKFIRPSWIRIIYLPSRFRRRRLRARQDDGHPAPSPHRSMVRLDNPMETPLLAYLVMAPPLRPLRLRAAASTRRGLPAPPPGAIAPAFSRRAARSGAFPAHRQAEGVPPRRAPSGGQSSRPRPPARAPIFARPGDRSPHARFLLLLEVQ